ncbi:MAG: hypothetical protein H7Y04_12975, partial [Verrucomicrobia bacterium]|nr:hypothetical protein [Cytophagales bacterium]
MKNLLSKIVVTGFAALFVGLTSCDRIEENANRDEKAEISAQDQTASLAESDDAVDASGEIMADASVSSKMTRTAGGKLTETAETITLPSGIIVTITPKSGNSAGELVIDFGSTGIAYRSRLRKGKVKIAYTGKYRENNAQQILTFENYAVAPVGTTTFIVVDNATKKTVSHVINGSIYTTTIKAENAKLTYPDGSIVSWNSDRVRNWDVKNTLFDYTDDEATLSGTFNGTNRNGVSYSVTSTPNSPLLYKLACLATSGSVPVQGKMTITPAGGVAREIDFGNGSCDRNATL